MLLEQLRALRRVRDRIDREFDRPLNVEELAAGVHMSAGHFSCRGDLSITDIWFTVGFSSLGTFSTRFSELVGISPRQYRSTVETGEHALPTLVVKNVLRPVRNREVRDLEAD